MTTHTDLIKRLREARKDHAPIGVLLALVSESSNALESLEQQVAALTEYNKTRTDELIAAGKQVAAQQVQMYEDRKQALVWRDQVAELTDKLESHGPEGHNVTNAQHVALREQLAAAQADNARLRKQLIRVVGDHNPPRDCYATGPMTGNDIEDLVSCPSCEAEVLLALPTDDSALQERLKEERERCKKECEGFTHRDDKEVAEAIAAAIGSMT